jgi:hypothetical protein
MSFSDDSVLMEKLNIKNEKEFIEVIASLEHDQWIDWAKALMKNEKLSKERIERWEGFMVSYDKLSEKDKEPDRKYAKAVLSAIKKKLEIDE